MDPIPMPVLDSKTAYNFLRMRRSIRNFTPELVSEDKMRQLLDIARYAPTAANSQGLYYIVVSDQELIRKICDCVADWMQEEIDNDSPAAGISGKCWKYTGAVGWISSAGMPSSWCSHWPAG